MAAPKFYEGQEFHNPNDPSAPVLVYRAGKFLPKDANGNVAGPPAKIPPQDAKALAESRAQAEKSVNTATQAERFLAINRNTPTGGIGVNLPVVGGMIRAMKGAIDPDYAQMEGINASVAPGLRVVGSGSSSDKDVELYQKGFTNVKAPLKSNIQTYDRLHQQSDHDAARSAFLDKWVQTKGTLAGGEQGFLKYWAGTPQAKTPYDSRATGNAALKAKSAKTTPAVLEPSDYLK